jgi:hypothetical protein
MFNEEVCLYPSFIMSHLENHFTNFYEILYFVKCKSILKVIKTKACKFCIIFTLHEAGIEIYNNSSPKLLTYKTVAVLVYVH